jgi:hypothetical protein
VLLGLCACGARTELAGTKISSDAGAQNDAPANTACHDEIVATDAKGATVLALDGDAVFWGTQDGLVRARDGAGVVTFAKESDAISSIAVDAQYVYYALTGSIRRVPRGGGPVSQVISNAGQPFALTPRGADLYWVDYGSGIAAGSVHRNDAKIITELDTPSGLAVDGSRLFVACALALVNQQGIMGPLLAAGTDGSGLGSLLENLHEPGGLTTFGGRVYYIEQTDAQSTLHGGVRSVDENGGDPTIEITTDGYLPIDVAADASGIYVTALSQSESVLMRGATVLAKTTGVVYEAVRASPTAVYWTIAWTSASPPPPDGATVRKICK